MNSGEPFNKTRQVGLVLSYLSTLLQMFIMSCVYNVEVVCLAPSGIIRACHAQGLV